MSRKKKPFIEAVEIEAVAAEGNGLAHVDGQVLFVQQAVPGDIVDVQVNKVRRGYMAGYVTRLVNPSARRAEPFCPHYGVCGGCAWQILPYQMQLDFKQQQVYDQLVRIGHLEIPEISPILGSEKTEYYRNKLEFTFSNRRWEKKPLEEGENAQPGLGFHVGKYFDKVLDIEDCHLQADPSNAIRNFIRSYALEKGLSFYNIRENRGYLRNIIIRSTQAGNIMLIVVISDDDDPAKRERLLDSISKEFPQISSLYYVINSKLNDSISDLQPVLYRGDDAIYEEMEGLHFKIGPKSFYQTNSRQAYRLYSVAREFAGLTGNEVVYDLYTGTGTIAQFVSGKASKVIGIEYVPEAIDDAVLNAANNGITNCEFFAGDMKDILTADFIAEHGKPDVIILDPPRAGIHPDVASVILETAPSRMVYVSCNPASQARDLAILSQKYTIEAVQPVDMFPHTQHVENVCKLKLKEK